MSAEFDDMDDVLADIERSERLDVDAGGETDLDRPMSRLSVNQPAIQLDKAPTMEELQLGRKVLALEKERDAMAAELETLRAKQAQATSTTIPAPLAEVTDTGAKVKVPHDLLPVLSVLRHHISELSRDNHALRYTFGLDMESTPIASSSKVTLDTAVPDLAESGKGKKAEAGAVNLEAVVRKVKELVRENEELGDVVVEAGKASTDEWQRALDESKKVITSLDNDLQHHFDTVQDLRQQLDAYINHFGPLPSVTRPSGAGGGSSGRRQSTQPPSPRSSQGGRHQRDSKDRRGGGGGRQSTFGGQHTSDGRDRRERDRDRDRDRDRGGRGGQSSRGSDRPNGFGQGGRREDDRASKRRR